MCFKHNLEEPENADLIYKFALLKINNLTHN